MIIERCNIKRNGDGEWQWVLLFKNILIKKKMRFDIIVSFDSLSMKEMFNHVVQDVRDAFPDYDVQVQFDVDISD